MKTLLLHIPESIELDEKQAKTLLASKLYELGDLSLGQAAEMADYSKRDFMEILGSHHVSLFNYDVTEIENDISNAKNYHL
jgi:predicted HTH domain antitoxin